MVMSIDARDDEAPAWRQFWSLLQTVGGTAQAFTFDESAFWQIRLMIQFFSEEQQILYELCAKPVHWESAEQAPTPLLFAKLSALHSLLTSVQSQLLGVLPIVVQSDAAPARHVALESSVLKVFWFKVMKAALDDGSESGLVASKQPL